MNNFLYWLFSSAVKVYQWFGEEYEDLYNTAKNAWNWIVLKAYQSYLDAITYAYSLYYQAVSAINSLHNLLDSKAATLLNYFINAISDLQSWTENKISQIQSISMTDINNLIGELWNYILSIPSSIQQWVNDRIAEIRSSIQGGLSWLYDSYNYLLNLITGLPLEVLSWVTDFINNDYPKIKLIIDNPVGFIFEMIWSGFVSALCFFLAYGLGTTKQELPIEPPWRGK